MRLGDIGSLRSERIDPELYAELGQPLAWREKAEDLRVAAETLWNGFMGQVAEAGSRIAAANRGEVVDPPKRIRNLKAPAIMLMGMAIENLLKGILVARNPNCLSEGHLPKDKGWKVHELVALAEAAGVTLNSDETNLCEMGTAAIAEWGRYPISRHCGEATVELWHTEEVINVFRSLCQRLTSLMEGILGA